MTSDTKYIFLISHHNIIRGFGPHNEFSDKNFLSKLIEEYPIEASFQGHDHNMQVLIIKDSINRHLEKVKLIIFLLEIVLRWKERTLITHMEEGDSFPKI